MADVNLPLILGAALIATASPGPATLAIAGAAMAGGRRTGLALAAGVTTGSWLWSAAAAAGLGAVMAANVWAFEALRYLGGVYLLYLAARSAHSAWRGGGAGAPGKGARGPGAAYGKGLALHLTNPKAIAFFGALFAVGVPADAPPQTLALVVAAVGLQSLFVFHGYALLFASAPLAAGYARMRRAFDTVFALAFGAAGAAILTGRTG